MNPKPLDTTIYLEEFHVDGLSRSSGLFIDGPFHINNWRVVTKKNMHLNVTGNGQISTIKTVLRDNDEIDQTSTLSEIKKNQGGPPYDTHFI